MQVKLLVMQLGVVEQLVASFCAEEKVFFGLTMTTVDISQSGAVAPDFNKAKIATASTVALVGESGCGKSTVISLLQRFYDPDSGQIALDRVEIHRFRLKWLRQQMGLVSQETFLFNETIRTNILYGNAGNATEVEIISATKLANAHEFISGFQ
ncbi:hypothetical protein ACSBR2_031560 [Camellia fascicularis]